MTAGFVRFPANFVARLGLDAIPTGHAVLDMSAGGTKAARARIHLVRRLNDYGLEASTRTVDAIAPLILGALDEAIPGWRDPLMARRANRDGRHPVPGRRQRPRKVRTSPPEPGFDMRGIMNRVNRLRVRRGEPQVPEDAWPRTHASGAPFLAELARGAKR